AGDLLTPLCWSSTPAMCSSRITFAGQRPDVLGVQPCLPSPPIPQPSALVGAGREPISSVVPILHASMLSAPVPCSNTFAATVSLNGFLAATIGSTAGFNAVPQPSHSAASGVAGAVMSTTCCPPCLPSANSPVRLVACLALPVILLPTTLRSTPAALSIAFPTSCDLG